ncbi:MAG: manganese efflux pump, partial [Paludibacteraceae bacterium]|nr:manganese efflux pump [Paludibacteraceae bacterium]
MDLLSILLIAIGLAMDCFAVSIAQGLTVDIHDTTNRPKPALMALLFGLFQGGMPLIGYYAGSIFSDFFDRYAPWIALGLLAFIGGKMIWESLHEKDEQPGGWQLKRLLILAVATSIDALATGVIFIPVPERLWLGVSIIGVVSFLFSLGGYCIGVFVGKR